MQEGWYWIRREDYDCNAWHVAYFDGVWLREFGYVGGTGSMWKSDFPEAVFIGVGPSA